MEVLRLSWVGTRTDRHDETVALFRDTLGLSVVLTEKDFTVLKVPDGSTVEVFGPESPFNRHLVHPVAGFSVSDLDEASGELQRLGVEIVLPVQHGDTGSWLHFRAPDGFVYELSSERPRLS